MSKELYSNIAGCQLAAEVADGTTTSITVSGTDQGIYLAANFPATGNFRILVERELMLVTAISGTTWTVTRGVEGTTAASHPSGSTVYGVLTDQALRNLVRVSHGGSIAAVRRELNFTDGGGATWSFADDPTNDKVDISCSVSALPDGPGTLAYTVPAQADFSSDVSANGSSSITWTGYGAYVSCPATSGDAMVGIYRSAPATPYRVTARVRPNYFSQNYTSCGIFFRESSSGKIHRIAYQDGQQQIEVDRYNSWTSYNSADKTAGNSGNTRMGWFQVRNDGTNLTFLAGSDGIGWIQLYQCAVGAFVTPDQVGFGLNGNTQSSGLATSAVLLSWKLDTF
jgi:hypothetical protein